jgi:small subunit ribosomal protein S20
VANVASAEKRNRQRIKRRARNQFHLSTMRTHVKRVRTAVESKDAKAAEILDKAAQKGVIDKKAAARKISRLTKSLNRANA